VIEGKLEKPEVPKYPKFSNEKFWQVWIEYMNSPAKLLDYFLWSNKSNINQLTKYVWKLNTHWTSIKCPDINIWFHRTFCILKLSFLFFSPTINFVQWTQMTSFLIFITLALIKQCNTPNFIWCHPDLLFSVFKVELGNSRTNEDPQWNPVYNAFHRFFCCGNETICQ